MFEMPEYNTDMNQHEVMNKATEAAIVQRIVDGDESARMDLVSGCLKMSVSVANRFDWAVGRGGLDFNDIVQFANTGLVLAATNFDPARGFRFSTYAITSMRNYLNNQVKMTCSTIRVPTGQVDAAMRPGAEDSPINLSARKALAPCCELHPIDAKDHRPKTTGTDRVDLEEFHSHCMSLIRDLFCERDVSVLLAIFRGESSIAIARDHGVDRSRIGQIKNKVANRIRTAYPVGTDINVTEMLEAVR